MKYQIVFKNNGIASFESDNVNIDFSTLNKSKPLTLIDKERGLEMWINLDNVNMVKKEEDNETDKRTSNT